MRKKNVLNLYQDYQNTSALVSETVKQRRKQKKREEVFWEIQLKGDKTGGTEEAETHQLMEKIAGLRRQINTELPEVIDRLEYASQALFKEIARGFFLSFCSVAVACVARIRVLLQNLGSQILYEWPIWEKGLIEIFGKSIESTVVWESESMNELQQSFHPSNGSPPGNKKGKDQARELLRDLGVDIRAVDAASHEEPLETNGVPHALLATEKSETKSRGDDTMVDFGERLSSVAVDAKDEVAAPDYMVHTINQVQNNLALSRKAKSAAQTENAKALPSSKSDKKKGAKLDQQKEAEKRQSTDLLPTKAKKKKRKDFSSKSKSSKKSKKSSGEFFDNLFK